MLMLENKFSMTLQFKDVIILKGFFWRKICLMRIHEGNENPFPYFLENIYAF